MREYLRSLGFSIISDYTRNTPNAFVLKVIKGRDGWTQVSLVLEFVHLGMLFKKLKYKIMDSRSGTELWRVQFREQGCLLQLYYLVRGFCLEIKLL